MLRSFCRLVCIFSLAILCSCGKSSESDTDSTSTPVTTTTATSLTRRPDQPATQVPEVTLPKEADGVRHEGPLVFATQYGSPQTDAARDIAIDAAGDYFVVGYFRNSKIFGQNVAMVDEQPDAFLTKLSKTDGEVIWFVPLGGANTDIAESVAVASDGSSIVAGTLSEEFRVGNGVLTSEGADDIFIAKFADDGRRLWAKRIGGADIDAAHSVVIDPAGNSYVTGVFRHVVVFGNREIRSHGNGDIFVTKLSPTGESLWTRTFGAVDDDYGRDLALDSRGNILLLAEIANQVDFGGGAVTTRGNRDIVLAKFTPDGTHLWSKSMGSNYDDMGISIAIDPADNLLFTGSFQGTINCGGTDLVSTGKVDLLVAKFNPNGDHIWSRHFTDKDDSWGNSIASDAVGNSYISGWFRGAADFDGTALVSKGERDALIVKLDPKGRVLWAKSFGNKSLDMGKAVAVTPDGGVAMVGVFNISIDFGRGELRSTPPVAGRPAGGDIYLSVFGH